MNRVYVLLIASPFPHHRAWMVVWTGLWSEPESVLLGDLK